MSNLDVWNAVKQAPKTALKPIKFGYLKGKSDINPQWRLQAMTEQFGAVGHGWTYRIVRTWSEACTDGTVMCFTEVAVKTKINGEWGEEFSGIGGSAIVDSNKNGISANDEGYKKSTTDALGVAFKAVGVAADIYLGNFDGSKYKDEAQPQQAPTQPQQAPTQPLKPKLTQEQLERAIASVQAGTLEKERLLTNYSLTDEQRQLASAA